MKMSPIIRMEPLFVSQRIVITLAAIDAMEASPGNSPLGFIARHFRLDRGELDHDSLRSNRAAIKDGSEIISIFMLGDMETRLWIVTDAVNGDGNRVNTTVMLEREFPLSHNEVAA